MLHRKRPTAAEHVQYTVWGVYSVGCVQCGVCTVWGVYSVGRVQCGSQCGACTVWGVYSVGCVQCGLCTVWDAYVIFNSL